MTEQEKLYRTQRWYTRARIFTMVAPWVVLLVCSFGCLWFLIAGAPDSGR